MQAVRHASRSFMLHSCFTCSHAAPEESRFEEVLAGEVRQWIASSRVACQVPLLEGHVGTRVFERLRTNAKTIPKG